MNQEKVYLADIAGYKEEKEEAVKLIDVLKNYESYTKYVFLGKISRTSMGP